MCAHSVKSRVLALAVMGVLAVGATNVTSAGPYPREKESGAFVATAQRFLQALWPELNKRGLIATVTADGSFDQPWSRINTFALQIGEGHPGQRLGVVVNPDGSRGYMIARQFAASSFMFDAEGLLLRFSIQGETVARSESHAALARLVDENPQWSEQQCLDALRAAGARFGPTEKTALLRALPINKMEPLLGKLKITSLEFETRHEQVLNGKPSPSAILKWALEAEAKKPGKRGAKYTFTFEPFEGRLIFLARRRS